jgi:hypothetical protein
MRERGMSTVSAVLVAAAAGLVTSVFLMDWMVVDVRTTGEDAVHLVVPFPLAAGHVATALIPDEALEDARVPPHVAEHREQILGALRSLAEAPDATLVEVEDDGEKVRITKEGPNLRIAVDASDATVRCTVPIEGVLETLERWDWQTADPGMIFDVLSAAPRGDLVRVEADDGTKVAITMW